MNSIRPPVSSVYRAGFHVFAATYGDAIEKAGGHMDAIWGNGRWSLVSCRVEPHLYTNVGEPLSWRWDFEFIWHGQTEKTSA